jgi:tetratricopeptide (TPR) repeat protein
MRAAQYYWLAGDSDRAYMLTARAIAIDPADPLVVGASLSRAIEEGRMEDAVDLQRRITATDPLSASNRGNLGGLLVMTGDLDEARVELERALELSPASENTTQDIAHVLILQQRTDEALKVIQQLPAGYGRDLCLALVYFVRGNVVEGDAMLARLLALGETSDLRSEVAVDIAAVYAVKNEPDQAFKWLELARRRTEGKDVAIAAKELTWNLQTAPFLKPLHADPRWGELLTAIHAQSSRRTSAFQ